MDMKKWIEETFENHYDNDTLVCMHDGEPWPCIQMQTAQRYQRKLELV